MSCFSPIKEILDEFKHGRMVVLVDDSRRENEGDLAIAAEKVTAEAVNFMITEGRGLVCLSLGPEIADRLNLPLQTAENTSPFTTGFTVTIDAKVGTTTGVSAADRATTILTAVRDDCRPGDLARPGHVFPLRAREGGCLVRAGQTEGSVDLARLAGLRPAAVICEVMNPNGTMARVPELAEFCTRHGLKMCRVEDIIRHRTKHERIIEHKVSFRMPTLWGEFNCFGYTSKVDADMHIAVCRGAIGPSGQGRWPVHEGPVLVRVHSQCLTGDALGSLRCDCREQLHEGMRMIAQKGEGVLLYMRQEGRGIGLENKLHAYALQDEGKDTVEANECLGFAADERDYGVGSQILYDLGLRKLNLLTNNPRKYHALAAYGLEVNERVPIVVPPNPENERYLRTKKDKLGHML